MCKKDFFSFFLSTFLLSFRSCYRACVLSFEALWQTGNSLHRNTQQIKLVMSNPSNHHGDEVHPIVWIEPPRGSSPSQPSPRSPGFRVGSPPGKADRPRIIEVGDAPLGDARIEVSQSVGDSSQAQNGTAPLIIPGLSQDDLNVIEENKVLQDLLEEGPDNHAQLFVPKTRSEILQRHVWVITTSPEEFPNITVAPWEVLASKVFQIVSLLFVLLSVVGLCVESLPEF